MVGEKPRPCRHGVMTCVRCGWVHGAQAQYALHAPPAKMTWRRRLRRFLGDYGLFLAAAGLGLVVAACVWTLQAEADAELRRTLHDLDHRCRRVREVRQGSRRIFACYMCPDDVETCVGTLPRGYRDGGIPR